MNLQIGWVWIYIFDKCTGSTKGYEVSTGHCHLLFILVVQSKEHNFGVE